MGKLGGLLAIATAALVLSGCGGVGETAAVETSAPAGKIQPFAATAPSVSASPDVTVDAGVTTEEQSAYLVGIKKAWRIAPLPSDTELIGKADVACGQMAQGMDMGAIGATGGDEMHEWDNAAAVAVYAGRFLCTEYSMDVAY